MRENPSPKPVTDRRILAIARDKMSESDARAFDALEELEKHPTMQFLYQKAEEGYQRYVETAVAYPPMAVGIPDALREAYAHRFFASFIPSVMNDLLRPYVEETVASLPLERRPGSGLSIQERVLAEEI